MVKLLKIDSAFKILLVAANFGRKTNLTRGERMVVCFFRFLTSQLLVPFTPIPVNANKMRFRFLTIRIVQG